MSGVKHLTIALALTACAEPGPALETAVQPLCESGGDCCPSPIIIDVAGDGIRLTGWRTGVTFELRPGIADSMLSWTEPDSDDAWLVLDRDRDGRITSGTEMFGNFTPQLPAPQDHRNGFAALAIHDANGDGRVDGDDPDFRLLRLWQDRNHDGVSQPEELQPLLALGIAGLGVGYREESHVDEHGNGFRFSAPVYGTPGSAVGMTAWDVFLYGMRPAGGGTARSHGGGTCPEPPFEPNLYLVLPPWPYGPDAKAWPGTQIDYNFFVCNNGEAGAIAHYVRARTMCLPGPSCGTRNIAIAPLAPGECRHVFTSFTASSTWDFIDGCVQQPNWIELKADSTNLVDEQIEYDNEDAFLFGVWVPEPDCPL